MIFQQEPLRATLLCKVLTLNEFHGGRAGHHGDLIATEGAGMSPGRPPIIAFVIKKYRQRVTSANCFRQTNSIGDNTSLFKSKQIAVARYPRLYFVNDQRNIVDSRNLT